MNMFYASSRAVGWVSDKARAPLLNSEGSMRIVDESSDEGSHSAEGTDSAIDSNDDFGCLRTGEICCQRDDYQVWCESRSDEDDSGVNF